MNQNKAAIVFAAVLLGTGLALVSCAQPAHATEPTPVETCEPSDGVSGYDEIVVDSAEHWQRYSWTGGPHAEDDAPAFPSDDWQPNVQGDPHNVGLAGAYFRSHGNAGNGDWFYLELVPEVSHIVHHDEVPPVTCPPVEPPVCAEGEELQPADTPSGYVCGPADEPCPGTETCPPTVPPVVLPPSLPVTGISDWAPFTVIGAFAAVLIGMILWAFGSTWRANHRPRHRATKAVKK